MQLQSKEENTTFIKTFGNYETPRNENEADGKSSTYLLTPCLRTSMKL